MSFIKDLQEQSGPQYVKKSILHNLNTFNEIRIIYDKLIIEFVVVSKFSSYYIKQFLDRESMDKFIKDNLENHHVSVNIKKLESNMEDLKNGMEEIKDMIKYMPGNQVYTDANEDFIAQQKN